MSFTTVCPNCGGLQQFPEERSGLTGPCDTCSTIIQLLPTNRAEAPTIGFEPPLRSAPRIAETMPSMIDRYEVIDKLGEGGMGTVYLARDSKLNRRVALKVPTEDYDRFRREARVAAQFHHPNFCPIHDIGEVNNKVPFLVMAYIDGKTLAEMIVRGQPWETRRAAELVRDLAVVLDEAHGKGVVHRDLKPSNIMIDQKGHLFLMDFGLARQIASDDPSFTAVDAVIGTATYMSPEQAAGHIRSVGIRSDLYSLGVILYELLTGCPPFRGTKSEIIVQVIRDQPPVPSSRNHAVDPVLEAIVLKAMAKNPDERFASMDDFAQALGEWLDPNPSSITDEIPVDLTSWIDPPLLDHQEIITNSVGMNLALLAPGEFFMGAPDDEPDANANEKPRHPVRITRPFYLGVYVVTQAEYQQVTGTNPSWFSTHGAGKAKVAGIDTARFPVENVSWLDAIAFCNLLSHREGLRPCFGPDGEVLEGGTGYRLPTEAEWEYACRAGTTTAFAVGDRLATYEANFDGNHTYNGSARGSNLERTTPVGSYRSNGFGLFDMHGNVWEWCCDWYHSEYYKSSTIDDPPGATETATRVIRGGSWLNDPSRCRSANRRRRTPGYRGSSLGFRVARDGLGI